MNAESLLFSKPKTGNLRVNLGHLSLANKLLHGWKAVRAILFK
jgi:hypothetical protein